MYQNNLSREQIFLLAPLDLVDWLHDEFPMLMQSKIETVEDMDLASNSLLRLTAQYSYLCELLSYAKIIVREAKRNLPKEDYEDMVDRQNAIEKRLDIVKQEYLAVSRAVTIKSEINKEMYMGQPYNRPTQQEDFYDKTEERD